MAVELNPEVAGGPSLFEGWNYTLLSANTTTTIKTGTGNYGGVVVTAPGTTWAITLYDNTTNSGTILSTFTAAAGNNGVPPAPGVQFLTGLTFAATGTAGTCYVLWK